MIQFPNCKINLGLSVIRRRDDGYHDLETMFYPVPWKDVLEVVRSEEEKFFVSGNLTDPENNICTKAYRLLKEDHDLPPVTMHLYKNIPMGAGLGGGSADGAFTLRLLNEIFQLQLTTEQLISYALQLGSDCPFFIINKPCVATGRGEKLKPVNVSLSGYFIQIVYPGIHVSTAEAFKNVHLSDTEGDIENIISSPVTSWKDKLTNAFEKTVFEKYPAIGEVKQQLYDAGALYASMSGSGSAVFGIFAEKPGELSFPENYRSELFQV